MVAPVIAMSGIDASIFLSPERKVRKTSHQVQIGKQNKRKSKAIHAQAHMHATPLVSEERAMPREDRQKIAHVIAQVHREFSAWGYGVTLSKNTINRYVALGMVGTFPLARRFKGMMPRHAFELLVLAGESYFQICSVNSIDTKQSKLMMAVNTCCGVAPAECRTMHSVYHQVMKLTNVSLNADVPPAVKDRRVQWTTYANLDAWFDNFWAFLIKFDFAGIENNGAELMFMEAQLRWIKNINKTEVSLDAHNTKADGRPAVLFHNPSN